MRSHTKIWWLWLRKGKLFWTIERPKLMFDAILISFRIYGKLNFKFIKFGKAFEIWKFSRIWNLFLITGQKETLVSILFIILPTQVLGQCHVYWAAGMRSLSKIWWHWLQLNFNSEKESFLERYKGLNIFWCNFDQFSVLQETQPKSIVFGKTFAILNIFENLKLRF